MAPGFADPVRDSQACFRAVLNAMAQPGHVHTVALAPAPPQGLGVAAASVLLTLADADTPVFLDDAGPAHWLAFHCGARLASAGEALLAVVPGDADILAFASGTDDAPEDGATVLLQVAALGTGPAYTLSGPGLPSPAPFQVDGLPRGFAAAWAVNAARFPRGVDVILCAGDRLAALPRTLQIVEA